MVERKASRLTSAVMAGVVLGLMAATVLGSYAPSARASAQPIETGAYRTPGPAPVNAMEPVRETSVLPGRVQPVYGEAVDLALGRANFYREQAGISPLSFEPSIQAAAEVHADYYLLNVGDAAANAYGFHGEVEGKPGFGGRWPWDRLANTGYPWFGGFEVVHFIADPLKSVDDWISSIYHRVVILNPSNREAGYATRRSGGIAVDVMDLGAGPDGPSTSPFVFAYPADGQSGVPASWRGAEIPSPLPPGASRPVGYPFTLQGIGGKLRVDAVEMWDPAGEPVAMHPSPSDCAAFDCFALIAVSPLQTGATYTVRAIGAVGGIPFDQEWRFTTAS